MIFYTNKPNQTMKKIITVVAVIVVVAACKKESPVTEKRSTAAFIADIHEPGKYASVVIGTQKLLCTHIFFN
jgi:hypothetical protein